MPEELDDEEENAKIWRQHKGSKGAISTLENVIGVGGALLIIMILLNWFASKFTHSLGHLPNLAGGGVGGTLQSSLQPSCQATTSASCASMKSVNSCVISQDADHDTIIEGTCAGKPTWFKCFSSEFAQCGPVKNDENDIVLYETFDPALPSDAKSKIRKQN